jgi:tryptophan 2,3-dioxygenase
MNPEIISRIEALKEKYEATGQDILSYLDGLIYADYLTYWDYIHLDTLLSLQNPKTPFPDEPIFIMYHQITELYFKLSLNELNQIGNAENPELPFLIKKINRVGRYFDALTLSFSIMSEGMDPEQFLKFRMALLPASGFQSVQYRMIEISCTHLIHLADKEHRQLLNKDDEIEKLYEFIYWKKGATELGTGKKTYTLKQFEDKYSSQLIAFAKSKRNNNILSVIERLSESDQQHPDLIFALKKLDQHVNVNWPLAHYKTAVRYLHKNPDDIAATGGTNWQKYLPPRFQRRVFFPHIFSQQELDEWGIRPEK